MPARSLIVNADDFGLSEGTNAGIIEAHEHGVVTSASLMVRQPAVESAAAYARKSSTLGIGLHIDLGEWEWRNDEWVQIYKFVPDDDAAAVAAEIERQLTAFHALIGRAPTHLDSHQHVHQHEPVRSAAAAAAARLGIPLRGVGGGIAFCGSFYGHAAKGVSYPEGISVENLLKLLCGLPVGTTEMSCHPGHDEHLASCYSHERIVEVKTLCDPQVRAALEQGQIALVQFGQTPPA